MLKARDLVGSFDKPRYITFTDDLCAHSRSKIIGCHRCLDLCPTGAITPAGDHVAIDPNICAGCGQCAAACPTGAASYALPPADALLRKLRAMLIAYREAGGARAIVLLHDDAHGGALIDALARHGDGLPANVLPLCGQRSDAGRARSRRRGVCLSAHRAVRFLLRAKPRHDVAGLYQTIALAEPILAGLGFGAARVATIETDDPFALGETLARDRADAMARRGPPPSGRSAASATCCGSLCANCMHAAPAPVDVVALPEGAPFGTVDVNVEGCTLCLSCVSACPTGALSDDPERPMLRFTEDACVQCGLCKATCPGEGHHAHAATRFPRRHGAGARAQGRRAVLCIRCSKPFGVKSTSSASPPSSKASTGCSGIRRKRLDVIKMCADCRVIAMTEENFDPFGAPARPPPRTTEDYLRERERNAARADRLSWSPRARKSVSALRSSAEPMRCSGILVPGV